jgi:predicted helicase
MAKIFYARVDENWRREQKYVFLSEKQSSGNVEWQALQPDEKQAWLTQGLEEDFDNFLPIGEREVKKTTSHSKRAIFELFSLGVATNRDEWMYDFNEYSLETKVVKFVNNYNLERVRLSQRRKGDYTDELINNDPGFLKWTDRLKAALRQNKEIQFEPWKIRGSLYRPFAKQFIYFDGLLNQRRYQQHVIFPILPADEGNRVICLSDHGFRSPFSVLITSVIPDLHLCASSDGFQCFPFYTYNDDGTNRRENITDWALGQFRQHYGDEAITKWEIFHYVYAVLHHPVYRTRYAANLKRELPRIPFAPDFHAFERAGARLAELHVNYEQQPEYLLEKIEKPNAQLDWRVERMKLSKDKRRIVYNDFLTLSGVPAETFEYRLGNRSALEWVIDQYQVTTDKRSGIVNDPNRADDPQYIVRLIGQVITVSLETMKVVRGLPDLGIGEVEQEQGE